MTGVVTMATVRYTLVKNGGRVQVLTGGSTGPTGATGPTGPTGPEADIAAQIHAATSKATPVDADEMPLADSAATWGLKKLTWANVKATLKAYFDTLYPPTANPTFTGLVTIGGQIKFPATQVASADANTLDDYEKGEFTPTLTFGGASVGITYNLQVGTYTKVGREVHFRAHVYISSKGSSTGIAKITGLPFTSNIRFAAPSVWSYNFTGITGSPQALVDTSSTQISLMPQGSLTDLTNTNFANDSILIISGTYFV